MTLVAEHEPFDSLDWSVAQIQHLLDREDLGLARRRRHVNVVESDRFTGGDELPIARERLTGWSPCAGSESQTWKFTLATFCRRSV